MMNRRNVLSAFGASAIGAFTSKVYAASEYPNRMIRYVVPFPAGGGVDSATVFGGSPQWPGREQAVRHGAAWVSCDAGAA